MVGTSYVYRREYTLAMAQFRVQLCLKTCWTTTEPKVHHQTVKQPSIDHGMGWNNSSRTLWPLHIQQGARVSAVKYISVLNSKVKLHMHISGATGFGAMS